MIPLQIRQPRQSFFTSRITPLPPSFLSPPWLLSLPLPPLRHRTGFSAEPNRLYSSLPQIPCYSSRPIFRLTRVSEIEPSVFHNAEEEEDESSEYLSPRGQVYRKTLALVECYMLAALTGLGCVAFVLFPQFVYVLHNYFGCFFSLPIVISSMRWGILAGRKTMVATTMLLLVLSGPVKALTYLVRAVGAVGYVLISSFLRRENILALITINIHASLTFLFTASGVYAIPSMEIIYTIFGVLVLLNCGSFVFLLQLLYSVFLTKAWDEIFFENAKMAGESYMVAA